MCKLDTYCPYCDEPVTADIVNEIETLPVLGVPITYEAMLAVCPTCGNVIGDARLEDKNLKRAYAIYEELKNSD